MTTPRYLAALSLLDQAGIPYTSVNDDAVEVDFRFILYTSSGYWREHFGIRHGYTVGELVSEIKRGTTFNVSSRTTPELPTANPWLNAQPQHRHSLQI